MPQVYRLEEYDQRLKDVSLIIGDGLCSNIYVLGRAEITIIDTGIGNKDNPIFPQLAELDIKPENIKQVIITHAHNDHAMGVFLLLEQVFPRIYVHEKDIKYIASSFGEALVVVNEGDFIDTEIGSFEVFWTPGHTGGSICLYSSRLKILISGDTVFPDGYYGRYDGESGSFDKIMNSLEKLTELDCEIMLPGHGSPVFKDANSHIKLSYNKAARSR